MRSICSPTPVRSATRRLRGGRWTSFAHCFQSLAATGSSIFAAATAATARNCANAATVGCTLVDYSEHLLGRARAQAAQCHHPIDFVRADARCTGLPSASFDHVLIMGNSLGYQQDPEADRQILAESHRLLQPGGWLLTDLADGAEVGKNFNAEAWHEIGPDIVVCRQREMQANMVYVREMVLSKQTGLIRDRTYSIRFYGSGEIVEMFEQAGFTRVKVVTDFSPHRAKGDFGFMNYRMIALGQKS